MCVQAVCPVALSSAQRAAAKCATAGYLTMTVLPQHVATPERADQLAWTLLTFYAFMAQHATSFKASPSSHHHYCLQFTFG